ncbi:MAG TPA: BON domain-containing protein [Chloroflexota bacterium]|nr:BON domain-containing protein [Chloroflexota bacterium]
MTHIEEADANGERLLGLSSHIVEDDEASGTYFPPTDPVVIGEVIACGVSPTSMHAFDLEVSELDGCPGDEALADAVRQELRTDAATSELDIDVTVEDQVAYLRGRVRDIEDVENAEEVAGRLPQLAEVVEQLVVYCWLVDVAFARFLRPRSHDGLRKESHP